MPPCPRKDIFDPNEIGIYHTFSRCVRRAFLCGLDAVSGRSFDHRKDWLEERTARLAAIFAMDVLDMCIMDNHMHHVVRNRPDIAQRWSREEVVRRWWQVCPKRREADDSPSEMTDSDLQMMLSDPKQVEEYRRRLCDLSWFMKELKEPLARKANAEEEVTGHFWAERFKSTRLLDEAAVLACSIYVDLNMVRAGIVLTPDDSRYTSAWHRIQSLLAANDTPWDARANAEEPVQELIAEGDSVPTSSEAASETHAADSGATSVVSITSELSPSADRPSVSANSAAMKSGSSRRDAWLAPIPESGDEGNRTSPEHRASDLGFLPMTTRQYLDLLDWTGRQVRGEKGCIPAHLPPILERLGLATDQWETTVQSLHGWFPRAMGRASAVADAATRAGRRWLRGVRRCRAVFGT